MTPTARAAIGLLVAAALLLVGGATIGLAAALAVTAATVIDMVLSRTRPQIERRHPKVLPRGHPVALHIAASANRAAQVKIRQPLPPDLVATPGVGVGTLDAELVGRRRGRHEIPGVATRVTGPLRLGATVRTDDAASEVVVYPDIITARRIARAVATGRFATEGHRRGRLMGIGTEFESIRDYTPDDDIRQVNWRATDRLGRPMSNQYRIDQDRDVLLVIDSARLMAAPLGGMTRLDAAVDAATAVAYTADVIGDRVGVVAFDRAVRRRVAPHRRGGEAVVQAIHDLEPTEVEADYDIAFQIVERMKRALLVLFTDLLEESSARPMLDAVPVLARRHEVLVAGSADVDLISAITEPPETVDDVMRAAIAVDALEASEQVAHRLQHTGVTVLQARPGGLPASCVRAYLEAKARVRI